MSEPRRLLDGEPGDFERSLLDSARWDSPAPAARRRTLVALGLGTGLLGASVSTATAASTGAWALLKWVGAGVVAGLVVVGTADRMLPPPAMPTIESPSYEGDPHARSPVSRDAAATPPRVEVKPVAATPPVVEAAPAATVAAATPAIEDKPQASPRAEVGAVVNKAGDQPCDAKAHASATPKAATPATLTEELKILDEAQKAMASSPARVLEILAAHDAELHMMRQEATLLRIEALSARGDKAGAASLAHAFLASFPRSPHASRVRSILEATGGSAPPVAP